MKPQQKPQAIKPVSTAIEKHQGSAIEKVPEYLRVPQGQVAPGFEEFEQSDVTLPRLSICQALTPQRSKAEPSYIEGLDEGDIFNSIMQHNYGSKVKIIPLLYFKVRLRFKPMDDGGGILCRSNDCKTGVGDPGGACLTCQFSQFGSARGGEGKGTDCSLIYNFPVLVANEEGRFTPESLAVLSLKSTGIPAAKEWITKISLRRTVMFGGIYDLSAKLKNEGNLKWYVPVIENAGFVSEQLMHDAELAYKAMRSLRDQGRLHVDEDAEAADEVAPF